MMWPDDAYSQILILGILFVVAGMIMHHTTLGLILFLLGGGLTTIGSYWWAHNS
jgi:hypothetical protein